MKFRPGDRYCAPALSKTVVGSSLILKVKRKKVATPKEDASNSEESEGERLEIKYEYSVKLMGICNKTYQFTGTYLNLMQIAISYKHHT